MAPVMCQVLNARALPIAGVYVTLTRKDLGKTFASFTSPDGFVNAWHPLLPDKHFGEPRVIDACSSSLCCFTIYTTAIWGPCNNPWPNIRADVLLTGQSQHCVVLYLLDATTYQVRHFIFPLLPSSTDGIPATHIDPKNLETNGQIEIKTAASGETLLQAPVTAHPRSPTPPTIFYRRERLRDPFRSLPDLEELSENTQEEEVKMNQRFMD